jgi:hypothetical protein
MAAASIEIPYLKKGVLVKDWKKGFLAATALLQEAQRVAILPLYVNRSSGDQQWAYKAAEKTTIKAALEQLELNLDGAKSKLNAAVEFFNLAPLDKNMTERSAISSFWFNVLDSGTAAGVAKDLIIYKFLQYAPQGNKIFEKMKETIKADISDADMGKVFDEIVKKLSEKGNHLTDNAKIKEEVFVANEPDGNKISEMIASLQEQINSLRMDYQSVEADSDTDSDTEEFDDEGPVYFTQKRKFNKKTYKDMYCSICKKSSHTAKYCNNRKCANCQGSGHDMDKCPSYKKRVNNFSRNTKPR